MENFEKASEISKHPTTYGVLKPETQIRLQRYNAAMLMAEWKDAQFDETKDEIKVDAKKELAWEIHKMIFNGATLAEVDHYACGICDF